MIILVIIGIGIMSLITAASIKNSDQQNEIISMLKTINDNLDGLSKPEETK